MGLMDRAQLDWKLDAKVGASNFSANGSSGTITTPVTTALSTAGDGGVAVPLQVAGANTIGVLTSAADNLVIIVNNATKKPIADAAGNEVYGRITESASVYTLSYYTLANGTETAYNFASATAIDFYFNYRFDAARLPKNAITSLSSKLVQQDPSATGGGGGSTNKIEKLTVTGLNTLSALSQAPTSSSTIFLIVQGKTENALGGAAAFSVSGTTITWNAANAGYALQTTMNDVIAFYW